MELIFGIPRGLGTALYRDFFMVGDERRCDEKC